MCAAPGGKSLVIAAALEGTGSLVSNDRSASRRGRLKRVIAEHLPADYAASVLISSHDATRWGLYEKDRYDRILLDAPCSSERHVLGEAKYLEQWSPSRTKRLAAQSFAMAAAALDALKPGGLLLYSTCTISRLENDGVIGKLLKRRPGMVEILEVPLGYGEKTEYGHMVLPDSSGGKGPMYIARLRKTGRKNANNDKDDET
jgi:16S rRNA C967 or C1407 C5-methylase (RsmB/RsmF family)